MQFLHQWIIQKVDPAEFMIDCSCAANYAHPKQLQDTTGCFCLLLFQEKKKKQISQKENPSHSTAPRSDRSVACHVFWCQWVSTWVQISQLPASVRSAAARGKPAKCGVSAYFA